MPDEADEAGGHQPANEENEVRCGFSPEKPCLPLSIEGRFLLYIRMYLYCLHLREDYACKSAARSSIC